MKTETKVAWADKVLLTNGSVGQVVEFDTQPPYTVKVALKDGVSGELFTRWIRTEDISKVMPKQ